MGTLKEIKNRYYKECNVVMLSTENIILQNDIIKSRFGNISLAVENYAMKLENVKPQHLYITTDEEIKEGDWYISGATGNILQLSDNESSLKSDKKIIATTDKSLKIDETSYNNNNISVYLEFPQPPQSFIKAFCEQGSIDKVLVEYERYDSFGNYTSGGDTLKDDVFKLKTDTHNTITIKPVKEKVYTLDELETIVYKAINDANVKFRKTGNLTNAGDWLIENL